jgi:hypothetical protein
VDERQLIVVPNSGMKMADNFCAVQAVGRYQEAIADCKSAIENDPEVCIPIFLPDKSILSLHIQLFGPSQFLKWDLKSVTATSV